MADGDVELKWKTDITAALREVAKLTKEIETLRKKEKKGSDESKKAAKEEIALKKMAAQVTRDIATPQEKHNQKLKELNKLLRANKITTEQHARATRKSADELKRAGMEGRGAFGPQALGRLLAFAGGLGTIAGAAAAARRAIGKMREEEKTAGQRQRGAFGGVAKLAQLAGGDVDKLKRLFGLAQQVRVTGGAESLGEAANVAFELSSAGLEGDAGLFSNLFGVIDPAAVVKSTGVIRSATKGKAGGAEQILSRGFAAASPVSGVGVSDVLEGAAQASASASLLGISNTEVLGAVSKIAETTGSGSEAGAQLNSLFKSLIKQGFADDVKGLGLPEILSVIRNKGLKSSELQKLLGRQEALKAIVALPEEALRGRISEVRAGEEGGIARRIALSTRQISFLESTRQARMTEGRREVQLQGLGIANVSAEALQSANFLRNQERFGGFRAAVSDIGQSAARFFVGDEAFAATGGGGDGVQLSLAEQKEQFDRTKDVFRGTPFEGRDPTSLELEPLPVTVTNQVVD